MAPRKSKPTGNSTKITKRLELYSSLKNTTKENLGKEFTKIVNQVNFKDALDILNEALKKLKESMPKSEADNASEESKPEVTALEASCIELEKVSGRLNSLHQNFLRELRESILSGAARIPENVFNIKDALESLANDLLLDDITQLYISISNFPVNIMRESSGLGITFTKDDLRRAQEAAFEKGYNKAIKTMKSIEDLDDRLSALD